VPEIFLQFNLHMTESEEPSAVSFTLSCLHTSPRNYTS